MKEDILEAAARLVAREGVTRLAVAGLWVAQPLGAPSLTPALRRRVVRRLRRLAGGEV